MKTPQKREAKSLPRDPSQPPGHNSQAANLSSMPTRADLSYASGPNTPLTVKRKAREQLETESHALENSPTPDIA